MKIFSLSVALTGALVSPAVACDLCSIYSAEQATGEMGRGFLAGVAQQYTHFGTLQDESQKVPGNGEYIDSSVTQLFLGYNVNNRFSLQFNVPIIYRAYGSATTHKTVSGIGDVSLIGNVVAYRKLKEDFTFSWSVLGGVKFPTGNPNHLLDPDSSLPDGIGGHDIALGSGSYDVLIGTSVYSRWKRTFASANLQYAIRSQGAFGHQYANDLTWSGGPGVYLALTHSYTLALQAAISGETKGKDTFSGVPDNDSAETIVYAGPQLNFTWSNKLSAQVDVGLPVSIYNSGLQVVSDYRVRAAVTWRF
ncbi:MAG: hypothetical protein JWR19_3684 [Pedosphaera sp.]|nr:hypothetical protein [Pedosphaera sp.]